MAVYYCYNHIQSGNCGRRLVRYSRASRRLHAAGLKLPVSSARSLIWSHPLPSRRIFLHGSLLLKVLLLVQPKPQGAEKLYEHVLYILFENDWMWKVTMSIISVKNLARTLPSPPPHTLAIDRGGHPSNPEWCWTQLSARLFTPRP